MRRIAVVAILLACEHVDAPTSESSTGEAEACIAVVWKDGERPRTCCCGGGPADMACDVGTPGCEGGAP